MKTIFASRRIWLAVGMFAGLGVVGYCFREPALSWFYVRQLSYAYQENRESCASKVASLEEAAWPGVFAEMRKDDAIICGNMHLALYLMAKKWGVESPRTQRLIEELRDHYGEFSPAGREKVLLLLTATLQLEGPRPLAARFTKVVSEVLLTAEKNKELRSVSLLLAAELVECGQPGQWVDIGRNMAERGLKDEHPAARTAAVQLLLRQPMRKDKDLLAQAVPLLRDTSAGVRKLTVIALASEVDIAREEHFLPLLHDDDPEVQYVCEMALRKRGLTDADIKVGRDLGDKNASTRMAVVNELYRMPDVNLSELLRRLSQDPEEAVRAAAVRAIGEHPHVDLAERLRDMAQTDANPTVQWLARFYLEQRIARASLDRR